MRPVVVPVACLCSVLTAVSAQAVPEPFESGIASWYSAPYHGRRSASGEIYDQEKLTAAHRTLPFGTRVRVRRLDRDRSVVVRINDRGPFVKSRIIDLSHAAAVQLGITAGGVTAVTLEVVETHQPPLGDRSLTDLTSLRKFDGDRITRPGAHRSAGTWTEPNGWVWLIQTYRDLGLRLESVNDGSSPAF
jgi:rare lipoprotein A